MAHLLTQTPLLAMARRRKWSGGHVLEQGCARCTATRRAASVNEARIDWRVLAFTGVVSIPTGMLFWIGAGDWNIEGQFVRSRSYCWLALVS